MAVASLLNQEMQPQYEIIDEAGKPSFQFDQILFCQEQIAKEFKVSVDELEKMRTKGRRLGYYRAYRHPDGRRARISEIACETLEDIPYAALDKRGWRWRTGPGIMTLFVAALAR